MILNALIKFGMGGAGTGYPCRFDTEKLGEGPAIKIVI